MQVSRMGARHGGKATADVSLQMLCVDLLFDFRVFIDPDHMVFAVRDRSYLTLDPLELPENAGSIYDHCIDDR
jgi:hypothetical protein